MSEWIEKPLSELAAIRVSNVDKKSDPSEHPVRLCNYMDVYSGLYLNDELEYMEATASAREIANFALQTGDVIITKDSESPDDIGIPAIVDQTAGSLVCGYHLAILRPNRSQVDPLFLLKQIEAEAVRRYYLKRAAGSTRYALATRTIEATPIKVAPLGSQRAISRILRAIDAQIEAMKALIAKQEQVRAGLMQDLFTRGVDEHGQLRPPRDEAPHLYHQTELGWLPTGWRVQPVQSVVRNIIDYRGVPPPKSDSGIPLITAKNVRFGYLDPEPREYIAEADFNKWMRRGVPLAGDVLFTTEAPLGNVAQIPSYKLALGQRTLTLQPDFRWLGQTYLKWALMSDQFRKRVMRLQSGSTATGIQSRTFRQIMLELPSAAEQETIVDTLERADSLKWTDLDNLKKLRLQKAGLMQDLLTGKVSVASLLESAAA